MNMYKIIKFENALWSILLCILALCSISCNELPKDCNQFDDWEIIAEEERLEACIYQQIYLYNNDYYSVCECCICGKASIMAIDCNEEPLCEFSEGCLEDFYQNAEYLYSAVEK